MLHGGWNGSRLGDSWTCRELPRASYELFGAGCGGGGPAVLAPHPLLGRRPVLGSMLVLQRTPPSPTEAMVTGVRLASPLPLGRSCSLLVGLTLVEPMIAQNGETVWCLSIPVQPSLAGATFANQAFAFDPSVAPPFVVSNGGIGTVGVR